MNYKIAVIKGDGIGPEIVTEAMRVLDAVGKRFGHTFLYEEVLAGGAAIDATGSCLPPETVRACLASDSVLLGAVGGPKWDKEQPPENRPEKALLGLRKELGLFANIRPATLYAPLAGACPIKPEIIGGGFDLVVLRELTGDVYFGKKYRDADGVAHDDMNYSVAEVERIAHRAFQMARQRKKHVTSVDKANVLETSRLWRETVQRVALAYPDVQADYMYVDNAAMQLVRNPGQFDVLLTGNLFGDILSDEASMITGSIGMLPSASLGETSRGMYEPIHGSAPDIAGKGIANPIATILSCGMMLRYSFDLSAEADAIDAAVNEVLAAGLRTADLAKPGEQPLSTRQMGDAVVKAVAG
ncbi:MAG: 3-isopropylmalate dehydrogenase [Oscillospiraceae bacterium]|nr:3-isopropylmalate dehydrogenase [Oscillospiraceae bacterium]